MIRGHKNVCGPKHGVDRCIFVFECFQQELSNLPSVQSNSHLVNDSLIECNEVYNDFNKIHG